MSGLFGLAPGKINGCLFIGSPRADGLHPLVSVVQPLSLADELTLSPAPGARGDEVVCPGVAGPNLAAEAMAAYRTASGWQGAPQRLEIAKRVPVAAGMGGGSADAAAALRLMAAAAGRPGDPAAAALAPALGSDVPAQLLARRCLIAGVGDEVEILPDAPPGAVLVLPSDEQLSTPRVYAAFDSLGPGRTPEELTELAGEVRRAGDGELPGHLRHNDLARAAVAACPSIAVALDDARATGADHVMVSGSGPTVIAFFDGRNGAARAHTALEALVGHPRAVVAEPVGADFSAPRER